MLKRSYLRLFFSVTAIKDPCCVWFRAHNEQPTLHSSPFLRQTMRLSFPSPKSDNTTGIFPSFCQSSLTNTANTTWQLRANPRLAAGFFPGCVFMVRAGRRMVVERGGRSGKRCQFCCVLILFLMKWENTWPHFMSSGAHMWLDHIGN